MGGFTTGIGLFSGIDSGSLIDQLLSVAARPRQLVERRMIQLQIKQSAYLDLNTALSSLRSASSVFRTGSIFDTKNASSSDENVLVASASKTAAPGSYSFVVDRLVSTQQMLSRGFADYDVSGLNAGTWSFEPEEARLDRDVSLATLNGGNGIDRGSVVIVDTDGNSATIDLSRVATINEVLDAINAEPGVNVTATVDGDKFVLEGAASVTSEGSATTAESLGLDSASATVNGTTLTGGTVYEIGSTTGLNALNDGLGVNFGTDVGETRYDFVIAVDMDGAGGADPIDVQVNIGSVWAFDADDNLEETETRVTTVGGVITRINEALTAATGVSGISASIDAASGRIVLSAGAGVDLEVKEKNQGQSDEGTTARDLGLVGTGTGGINGTRVLSGLNSTLLSNINGGAGLTGDQLDFTLRDGGSLSITGLTSATTVSELVGVINNDVTNAGRITASLDSNGTKLILTDTTGGTGLLGIGGTAASELGVDTLPPGVSADSVTGKNLQHRYMSESMLLGNLNDGNGIGTGKFQITDSNGGVADINIDSSTLTLGHVIDKINQANLDLTARINDQGDGIIIEEDLSSGNPAGPLKIKIEDTSGSVARNLRISGEATGTDTDNVIDGSFETSIDFDSTDTLKDIITKVNTSDAGVTISSINDGTGVNPFRLSMVSNQSGKAGRFILDSGGFDLGLDTLDDGNNARVFFGSSDPATGVLLSSSSNTLDSVISGVTIDLKSASEDPVTINITRDTEAIETKIGSFVDAFNNVLTRISTQTRFVEETGQRGPLLGDGTTIALKNALFNTVFNENQGFSETFESLVEVGLTVGTGGKMEFDQEKFREALEQDPDAVEALFARREIDSDGNTIDLGDGITGTDPNANTVYSELGVIPQIEEFVNSYISSIDGVLTRKNRSLDDQIKLQRDRIESMNKSLQTKRLKLQSQFIAMEKAIAQLQSQQSALSSIQLIG
jgi:flagellar hook-associated protein 2